MLSLQMGEGVLLSDLYDPGSGLNQSAAMRVFPPAEQQLPSRDPASGHIYSSSKDPDASAGSL